MTYALAFPVALLLLPAPWLVWRMLPPYRSQSQGIRIPFFRQITEAAGLEPKQGAVILDRRRVQVIAAGLCWVAIVLGLARPELLGQTVTVEKAARDLMLAVDVSGSMDANDMVSKDGQPRQRLETVKGVVNRFVADREGDRVGLIVFGTRAYVQSPFTEDLATIQSLLDQTRVGMAGPDTAVGDAIGLSIRAFQSSKIEQRLLILLSDGADTSSRMSPVNAAEIAAQEGVRIHAIGVGDPSGAGDERLDLGALEDLAQRTGGQFFFADDEEGLSAIYGEIDRLTPRITETVTFQPRQPLGWICFAFALMVGFVATGYLAASSRRRPA